MNTLYPIIRRVRRPLLPVDAPAVPAPVGSDRAVVLPVPVAPTAPTGEGENLVLTAEATPPVKAKGQGRG